MEVKVRLFSVAREQTGGMIRVPASHAFNAPRYGEPVDARPSIAKDLPLRSRRPTQGDLLKKVKEHALEIGVVIPPDNIVTSVLRVPNQDVHADHLIPKDRQQKVDEFYCSMPALRTFEVSPLQFGDVRGLQGY